MYSALLKTLYHVCSGVVAEHTAIVGKTCNQQARAVISSCTIDWVCCWLSCCYVLNTLDHLNPADITLVRQGHLFDAAGILRDIQGRLDESVDASMLMTVETEPQPVPAARPAVCSDHNP